jgi:hypothetical protein
VAPDIALLSRIYARIGSDDDAPPCWYSRVTIAPIKVVGVQS